MTPADSDQNQMNMNGYPTEAEWEQLPQSQHHRQNEHYDSGSEGAYSQQNVTTYRVTDGKLVENVDTDMGGIGPNGSNLPHPPFDVEQEDYENLERTRSHKSTGALISKGIRDETVNPRQQIERTSSTYSNTSVYRESHPDTQTQYKDRSPVKEDPERVRSGRVKTKPATQSRTVAQREPRPPGVDPRTNQKEKDGWTTRAWNAVGGSSTSMSREDSHLAKISQLEAAIHERDATMKWLKATNTELRTSTQSQEIEIKDVRARLGAEIADLTSQVRMAQDLMLKRGPKISGGLAADDKTIRHHFKKLQTDIRDWGRVWAHSDIGRVQNWENPANRSQLMKHLTQVIRISDDKLPQGLARNQAIAAKSPAICLSALVYNEICLSIFEKPFRHLEACLSEAPAPETRLVPLGDNTLEKIYEELTLCDEKKAQAWRCQTLEILDPSIGESDSISQARATANRRRQRFAQEGSAQFLRSPAGVFFRTSTDSEEKSRANGLQALFQQALEISARLWKQPTILRCQRLSDLGEQSFTGDSEFMGAHPLHQLGFGDEDEDETRLDHHRIMMVVSPAILGFGDSDGENYLRHRVWAKAVVWLED